MIINREYVYLADSHLDLLIADAGLDPIEIDERMFEANREVMLNLELDTDTGKVL